ncbi:MAG: TonB-dependent receptor [Mariprofundus sp.]
MLAIPCATHAQTQDLGEIDVTSSRIETHSITSSRPVTVIDRQTIENAHAGSVVDLLKGQANIVIRDTTGVGAKSQVDLGGFGESSSANNVVLIDGRKVNNPDLSGTDWTQIPLDQIERIEIVHGASSVLYGSGAVGGVINIITRVPASGGSITLAGGSFGEFSGTGRIGADTGKTRLEASFSGLTTNGYRDNNFFDRFDGGARAEADLTDSLSFHISGNHHRDRAGLPGALSRTQVASNRKQAKNPQDFSRTSDSFVDGGFNWLTDFGLEADLAGGFRRRDVHSEFVSFASVSDFVQRNASFRPKLAFTAGDEIVTRIVAGADIDRGNGSFDFGGFVGNTDFDHKRDGYYGQLTVGSADHLWSINGGARTERLRDIFTKGTVSSISNRETAWDAGASVYLIENLRLRLNASRSIRFPLLDERFSFFSGSVDTTLQPQTGRHYGASLHYDLTSAWLEFSASRADLNQEIYYNPIGGVFGFGANENYTDKTRHDVIMVIAHWKVHDLLQLSGNYTYSKATFRGGASNGKSIPAVPRNRFGLDWKADWMQGLSSNIHLTYVGASFLISDQANVRERLPSYLTADAVINYHWQDIEMFARVDNLTGKKYSNYGVFSSFSGDAFYPAPGVTFRAGASYSF